MDFELSDEQRLLKHSVERLLADHYTFEQRKGYAGSPEGWSRDMWSRYAELGLLALPFAEEHGGFGGGPVETVLVMEAFGRALVLEPYLASVITCGGILRHAASRAQKEAWIPRLAAGELTLAFAQLERRSRYDLHDVSTTARRDREGFVLDGAKSVVLHGDTAGALVVSARTAGSRRDRGGIGLFLVSTEAPGVARRGYATQDGMRAAEVTLAAVRVGPEGVLGDPENGLPMIERVVDETIAALAAEAVGAMGAAHALTVDYLKTRRQFGVPIGSFQALQHRAAEMFVALEQSRSVALLAAMMADDDDPAERGKAAMAAKVQVGRAGRFIGQSAIQLHGGMGMTMEAAVGHYFKRLTTIDATFGDADHHLARLAEAGGFIAAQPLRDEHGAAP